MPFPYLPGETPDAEKFGEGPNTYTPVIGASTTAPNLGTDGSATGWWMRVGPNFVTGGAILTFGTTGTSFGSGTWDITLPVPADTSVATAGGGIGLETCPGSCHFRDNTGSGSQSGSLYLLDATHVRMVGSTAGNVNNAAPFIWAVSDSISIQFAYPIVAGS